MNRSINSLLLFFLFPAMFFAIVVGFDIYLEFIKENGATIPWRSYVFIVFAGIFLLLSARRSAQRWVGVNMTRKPEKFIWSSKMDPERKKNVVLFLIIEAIIALLIALAFYLVTPEAWTISVVFLAIFVEQLVFVFVAPKWFRVGITHKAVVVADRETRILWFSGLRRVESHQQTIYFEYIEDLQLFFPANCITDGNYTEFRNALKERVNEDKVYFSEKFRDLK